MEFENYNKIILATASAMLGGFFGLLRTKMANPKGKKIFRNIAYIIAGLIFSFAVISFFLNKSDIFNSTNGNDIFSLSIHIAAWITSVGVALFTFLYYNEKDVYTTKELDPRINEWTEQVQKGEVKLVCGDMDFFGGDSFQIDSNKQYQVLKKSKFGNILIICRPPVGPEQEIRYGKIISELGNVTMKFYNPQAADLSIRGRIGKIDGVDKLIIYKKIAKERYQAIETDAGSSEGALIKNIWDLVWLELSIGVTDAQKNQFVARFKSYQ